MQIQNAERIAQMDKSLPMMERTKFNKHIPIYFGTHTLATTDEDVAITGILATDIVLVSVKTQAGTSDIAGLGATAEANNVNIFATGVGDGAGVVSYMVLRPY